LSFYIHSIHGSVYLALRCFGPRRLRSRNSHCAT